MSVVTVTSVFKHHRTLGLAVLMAGSVLFVSACSDDGSNGDSLPPAVDPNLEVPDLNPENIANALRDNVDYGTLLNLIEDADLAEALQNDNGGVGWTLFAPRDEAFANEAFESLSGAQMNLLVRNHLYSGRLASDELLQASPLEMTEGTVDVGENADGSITVGGARIVARDRNFDNGIIHFVDAVLQSQ